jgi:hypothetical protein
MIFAESRRCPCDRMAVGSFYIEGMTRAILFLTMVVSPWAASLATAAEPRVDLEVATDPSSLNTDMRAWSEMLSQAGFSTVRLRSGGGEMPAIQAAGAGAAASYRVIGVLTEANQLALPKGRFALGDRAKVEQWLRKLREGGEEAITVKPSAFGLLPRQLVAVHEALAAPIRFTTKDLKSCDAAKQIADGLSLKFISDPATQRALASDEPVLDELQGLSSGTALAAVLRPLGLVIVPEKSGIDIRLRIADSRSAAEHWPVGWPPKGNPRETLPELFKFLDVEIANTPLSDAITAIAGRLKAPVLLDHNGLARAGGDLNKKVTLPRVNTFYDRALDRLLSQAMMKYELRVDEADKPLLWITTVRR